MKMMTYLAAASFMASVAVPASAAEFNFSFTTTSLPFGGTPQNGSGIFTTSDTAMTIEGRNAFAITGIMGQINGVNISGLTPFATSLIPTYYYFTEGPTFLSGTGVNFSAGGFPSIKFYAPSATPGTYLIQGNGTIIANVTATSSPAASAVPEPASWGMMLLGFGAMGYAMRCRSKVKPNVQFA
ncbi:PEP-CTERM sorting domain-containing protein [Sphingomonas aliaeris]|uniref:PEP-CTERM sorting domain-containing protein n=1 Tax=Sphingomonas aliaeris TaxID=2759526 RepID=A0A974NV37_9SPHN|nr:PEPxxWA-CTERM sorting domain-containing protein [Sphingomonas aliaeris]QQV77564.1 PEP-CTERM sorting domain-containing protein [Sphingomonas aliaeris]